LMTPSPAQAWRGGWGWGPGLAGGLIAGAVIGGIASSAYAYGPGYGYYGGPGYGYYGGYAPAYGGYAPAYYQGGYAPAYYGGYRSSYYAPGYYDGPGYYGPRSHPTVHQVGWSHFRRVGGHRNASIRSTTFSPRGRSLGLIGLPGSKRRPSDRRCAWRDQA
jgi:hypothetical protein